MAAVVVPGMLGLWEGKNLCLRLQVVAVVADGDCGRGAVAEAEAMLSSCQGQEAVAAVAASKRLR